MASESGQLQGRRVLVTGAAGGIGRVMCGVLAARGAAVCALDRDAAGLEELAGGQEGLETLPADLADAQALAAKLDRHQRERGAFDCLVNNAAFILDRGSLAETDPESWREEIDVNLNGTYNITRALLGGMSRTGGAIVTVGSVNGLAALGHPAYSAAKAGLVSFAKAVAMEYGGRGVRSNVVLPGTVRTPAWERRAAEDPEIFERLRKWYPLGRIVEAGDVAKAACFLLSDDAAAVSGAVLNVDCGLMAGVLPFARELTLSDMG